jgi:hypothetical protein
MKGYRLPIIAVGFSLDSKDVESSEKADNGCVIDFKWNRFPFRKDGMNESRVDYPNDYQ